jgi:N-acetylmuramoyl-L-alanine amidase
MFKMKYEITPMYLTPKTKRRPAEPLDAIQFVVAHDTGNPNSTAIGNVKYYEQCNNVDYASAQLFVDDKNIIECIPTGLINNETPEKAWHVVYNTKVDNYLFGCEANDAAIGIEYCFGDNIDAQESYKRFIWVTAYICYKYKLDPKTKITGHHILDPSRKIDPKNGLKKSLGITYEQYLLDVVKEYENCTNEVSILSVQEDEDIMKLTQDQWSRLGNSIDGWFKKGWITDYSWATKAYAGELTLSELSYLNSVVFTRQNGIEV